MRCAQTLDVGVYVLGALSPAERDAFERHLGDCAICRDEVADLAVLPGLLGRLDLATAEAIARDGEAAPAIRDGRAAARSEDVERWAGPTLVPDLAAEPVEPPPDQQRWAGPTVVSLLDGARHRRTAERRKRRVYTFAAGLVAACLALIVGVSVPIIVRDSGPNMVPMAVAGAASPVSAELAFQPIAGGTKVVMHCTYSDAGATRDRWEFNLVALPRGGGPEVKLGNWSAGSGDDIRLTATTSLKPSDIARVELRRADGTALLRLDR